MWVKSSPILLEQQLFDPVGVQHLVVEQMAEHDEDRIMIKCLVDGHFLPFGGRELFQPFDEGGTFTNISFETFVQIDLEHRTRLVLSRILYDLNKRLRC